MCISAEIHSYRTGTLAGNCINPRWRAAMTDMCNSVEQLHFLNYNPAVVPVSTPSCCVNHGQQGLFPREVGHVGPTCCDDSACPPECNYLSWNVDVSVAHAG